MIPSSRRRVIITVVCGLVIAVNTASPGVANGQNHTPFPVCAATTVLREIKQGLFDGHNTKTVFSIGKSRAECFDELCAEREIP